LPPFFAWIYLRPGELAHHVVRAELICYPDASPAAACCCTFSLPIRLALRSVIAPGPLPLVLVLVPLVLVPLLVPLVVVPLLVPLLLVPLLPLALVLVLGHTRT
jgi:hypothetical protein